MSSLVVHPLAGKPLVGGVPVPSDRSIAHRALVFAALAEGRSTIAGFSRAEDNLALVRALRALGVTIEDVDKTTIAVEGAGLFGLRAPAGPIDAGRSRTARHLLAGLLVGQTFRTTLGGSDLDDVLPALRARGAALEVRDGATIIGPLPQGSELGELEHASPTANAETKGAILLSGLYAHGATWFEEPMLSRDHTERMMFALELPLRVVGSAIELDPAGWSGKTSAFAIDLPGDASAAAYLLAAAQLSPGSRVTVRGVGINPTRIGLLEIARHMGAGLEVVPQGERLGEPAGEVTAWHDALRPTLVAGELAARAASEIPLACALAARASGESRVRDVDPARLGAVRQLLRAFGVRAEDAAGGLAIEGRDSPLSPAEVDSGGDHAIAMSAAVLALHASGPSKIRDCDCIARGFPRFVGTLRALGARIDVEA